MDTRSVLSPVPAVGRGGGDTGDYRHQTGLL